MNDSITVHGYQGLPVVKRLHQALGGYFETYSQGLAIMRLGIEYFLDSSDPRRHGRNPLFDVLFAGMTAKPLADAFFAMSTIAGRLTGDDLAVRNTLRGEWRDHTEFRNDLAHGEWSVGWESMDGEPVPPAVMRVKMRDGLPTLTNLAVGTNDIIHRINDLTGLLEAVRAFSVTCRQRQDGAALALGEVFEIIEPDGQQRRRVRVRQAPEIRTASD